MYPLVLMNGPLKLSLIALLFLSPIGSIATALKFEGRKYYLSIIIIFISQLFIESIINGWWDIRGLPPTPKH